MIGRKIATVALSAVTVFLLALGAIPASASHPEPCDGQDLRHQECPPPPPRDGGCPPISAVLRIEEGTRATGDAQVVTVTAANGNLDTNAGAYDAQLVVSYEVNRIFSQEQTILASFVADGGGSFGASFEVPRFRRVTGLVRATIEDVGCDLANESVSLS